MFKWLFPLIFIFLTGAVHAQQESPEGPVFDPQGRLIPYDAKKPPAASELRKPSKVTRTREVTGAMKAPKLKSGKQLRSSETATSGKKVRSHKKAKPAADVPQPRKTKRVKRQIR